jgi:hypothetical protein
MESIRTDYIHEKGFLNYRSTGHPNESWEALFAELATTMEVQYCFNAKTTRR